MGTWLALCVLSVPLVASACSSDSGGNAGPSAGGTTGSGGVGTGGTGGKDASADAPGGGGNDAGPSCTNSKKDGDESDVDCGGACPPCSDGKQCTNASDCAAGVCQTTCQAPTCSDGVKNGTETGKDCGGSCPASYHGMGCVTGTNGSQVCSYFPNDGGTPSVDDAGVEKFVVSVSWTATGGNGKVNYVLAYGTGGLTYNSAGIAGGGPQNVCTSGAYTETFELPLGDAYTYKIWWADCIKSNACSGCGYDVVIAEGGPFGIAKDACL